MHNQRDEGEGKADKRAHYLHGVDGNGTPSHKFLNYLLGVWLPGYEET
jgi:hypothetical protein